MDQPKNGDVVGKARDITKTTIAATPPKAATVQSTIHQQSSSLVRRSSRSNKFLGPYYYSANKRTRDSQMDPPNENLPKLKIHPPPPLDPEMMTGWFPPRQTLEHVDIKKIRCFSSPNTGFSAKALASYAARHVPKVPASIVQKIRQQDALLFPTWYKYDETDDDEMKDKKTRICWAGGCHSWTEQSSGIPWVAVHGVDQICVIIIETYEVVGRSSLPATGIGRKVLSSFIEKVVAEMEAIEFRQLIDHRFMKGPFAVISFLRNPDHLRCSSEAPWATSDAEQCLKFLVDKLKDASYFSYNETVKTASSAMQYLFCNKLTPDDVLVTVAKKSDGRATEMWEDDVEGLWPKSAS